MEIPKQGKQGKVQTNPKQLADKYRVSWQQATDSQRKALCKRFGLGYISVDDEALLRQVATAQQASYRRSKEERQQQLVKQSSKEDQTNLQFALRTRRK